MKIEELLKGIDVSKVTSEEELINLIKAKETELKAKVLVDDGKDDIYIPKHRLDDEIAKKKSYKDQLDNVNTELEKLKTSHKDDAKLQDTITALQNEKTTLETKLATQDLETAIKLKAISSGSIDTTGSDVLAFIDKANIKKNEDGTYAGLDDAIKAIQTSKPYLFGEVNKGGAGGPGRFARGKDGEIKGGELGKKLAEEQASITNASVDARATFFK